MTSQAELRKGSVLTSDRPLSIMLRNISYILKLISTKDKSDIELEDDLNEFKSFMLMVLKHDDEKANNELLNVKYYTSYEFNLLSAAVISNNKGAVEFLVKVCKADVNTMTSFIFRREAKRGANPLYIAVSQGNYEICKVLLEAKANPNQKLENGSNAVRLSVATNQEEILYLLLEFGGDVNSCDIEGHSALMLSCRANFIGITHILLESKADPNITSLHHKSSALHEAIRTGNIEMIEMLVAFGAKLRYENLELPLISAACMGNSDVTFHLISSYHEYTATEIITCLELLGSMSLVLFNQMDDCINLWKAAMKSREVGCDICEKSETLLDWKILEDIQEFNTLEEVEQLRSNPTATMLTCILVTDRILGPKHPVFWQTTMSIGSFIANQGDESIGIDLWLKSLQGRVDCKEEFDSKINVSLHYLIGYFINAMVGTKNSNIQDDFKKLLQMKKILENIILSTKNTAVAPNPRGHKPFFKDDLLNNYLHIICIFSCIESSIDAIECFEFKKDTFAFLVKNPTNPSGKSLLHLACSARLDNIISCYPKLKRIDLIDLLVSCGSDINAVTKDGYTPYYEHLCHLIWTKIGIYKLKKSRKKRLVIKESDIMNYLFNKNCTLHSSAKIETQIKELIESFNIDFRSKRFCRRPTLKCLAAQKIILSKIPFETEVPQELTTFLHFHKVNH